MIMEDGYGWREGSFILGMVRMGSITMDPTDVHYYNVRYLLNKLVACFIRVGLLLSPLIILVISISVSILQLPCFLVIIAVRQNFIVNYH